MFASAVRTFAVNFAIRKANTVFSSCRVYKSTNKVIDLQKSLLTGRKDYAVNISEGSYPDIEYKRRLLSELNFESNKDAEPFTKLPVSSIMHIVRVTKNDIRMDHCKNRLYYIAERIKVPASVLSERLAKRTFIYSLSFEWLESSLNVLLEMGVPGDRIMRDLWVLKYHKDTILERLQRVKNMNIDKLYPWMVRCSEDILNRYINLSKETKDILGDTKTTQVYLSDRLNVSLKAVEEISCKVPALKTIRVTKVKSFLDFLENEGFSVEEIVNKPRILSASQKTVKKRLEKLRSIGITKINLNLLCRSRKDFKRYIESIESVSGSDKHLH